MRVGAQSADYVEEEFRRPYFAIKTNMAANMLAVPNVEIERHMGSRDRYSIMAELWFPWYFRHHKADSRELLNFGMEGRYWFGRQHALHPGTGLFTGVYISGGKYDKEDNYKGRQGEYLSLGITAGWGRCLARNLSLELSLSLGWVGGPQEKYEDFGHNNILIWTGDDHLNYFGPTKLKISLVYLIRPRMKKGGRR